MPRPGPASPRRRVPARRYGTAGASPGSAGGGARPRLPVANEISAGGLVYRSVDGVLEAALIGRLDRHGVLRWLLPKGHVEAGEETPDTAVREIAEETGITGHVVAEIGTVSYWFTAVDRRVHKTVHHYLLEADSGELSDADVEVDEVAWVPLAEVAVRLSYDDERRLAVRMQELLAGDG